MANEIYHRSNWGNAVNDIAWGDVYEKFDATNEMFVRSDNYENSNETDKLMAAINPKPSILLTPTAYDNGSLHSVKPVKTFGSELVTNGDFDTDSDWTLGNGWIISGGKAILVDGLDPTYQMYQSISGLNTKNLKVTFDVTDFSGDAELRYPFRENITGNGSYTFYGVGTLDRVQFQVKSGSTASFSIDNVSVKEVIDADFDFTRGTTATRVNEQGLIEDVTDTNLPRIDYTGGTGSLLLEPQSTNLLPYSEDFSQWNALGDTSIEGGYLAPDGSNTAYKVSGGSSLLNFNNISNETQTRTIYAKTVSGTGQAHLTSYFGNTNNLFTLNENWQRFEVNGTTTSTGAANFYAIDFRGSTDLTEVIIWGAQLEDLSYATSYIPTNGSTVTRDADAANNSGSSNLINSTEGVLYAEIAALANDGTNRLISLSDGTDDERLFLQYSSTDNRLQFLVKSSGSTQCNIIYDASDLTAVHKVAAKYKLNDFALWVDGVEIGTDTSGNVASGLSKLQFDRGYSGLPFYGKVKSVAVFKEALTDEELTALTT